MQVLSLELRVEVDDDDFNLSYPMKNSVWVVVELSLETVKHPWLQRNQSHSCSPQGLDEQTKKSEMMRKATHFRTQGNSA